MPDLEPLYDGTDFMLHPDGEPVLGSEGDPCCCEEPSGCFYYPNGAPGPYEVNRTTFIEWRLEEYGPLTGYTAQSVDISPNITSGGAVLTQRPNPFGPGYLCQWEGAFLGTISGSGGAVEACGASAGGGVQAVRWTINVALSGGVPYLTIGADTGPGILPWAGVEAPPKNPRQLVKCRPQDNNFCDISFQTSSGGATPLGVAFSGPSIAISSRTATFNFPSSSQITRESFATHFIVTTNICCGIVPSCHGARGMRRFLITYAKWTF